MDGNTITFNLAGWRAFIVRLEALAGRLDTQLLAANAELEQQAADLLADLYGPHLARRWHIESAGRASGELARLRLYSNDPRVRGYEFGTPAHAIAVHAPKRALAFNWNGAQAFYARVQHPGTRPHARLASVRLGVQMAARQTWAEALHATLTP